MNKIFLKIFKLINWKKFLLPVIIKNKNILFLAWVNKNSLLESLYFKKVILWSRSKKNIWRKGNTNSCVNFLYKISFDCDIDAIIFYINNIKYVCHYFNSNCFNYNINLI